MLRAVPLIAVMFIGCASTERLVGWAMSDRADLIDLIERVQRAHVRESTGVLMHQCFTEIDLARFKDSSTHLRAAKAVALTRAFRSVVVTLESMPEIERAGLLERARRVARPTWEEMGYIDTRGRGQTVAGHRAELMIAEAVVDEVRAALSATPPSKKQ